MMLFRTLKTNLVTILGDAAAGRFQVVGHQNQMSDASEVLGSKRRVQVFYNSGDFSKSKAGLTGPVRHEITYNVELSVSEAATCDLTVLDNPASTEAQRKTAIAGLKTAARLADESMDEFFEIVYQILMDGRNVDLGTIGPPYLVSNRWVSGMQKGEAVPHGEYVLLSGWLDFTCQAIEDVPGDTGTPVGTDAYDQTLDLDGDDVERTGVTV